MNEGRHFCEFTVVEGDDLKIGVVRPDYGAAANEKTSHMKDPHLEREHCAQMLHPRARIPATYRLANRMDCSTEGYESTNKLAGRAVRCASMEQAFTSSKQENAFGTPSKRSGWVCNLELLETRAARVTTMTNRKPFALAWEPEWPVPTAYSTY